MARRPCSSGVWRRQLEGFNREPGKSQCKQNCALNCGFLTAVRRKNGPQHLRRCCGCRTPSAKSSAAEPEGPSKRAKQRANGVRLRATPTDGRRQSPQVDGSSGDIRRRRNTQKIWFASRRPGVRVPLAPQVRGQMRPTVPGRGGPAARASRLTSPPILEVPAGR